MERVFSVNSDGTISTVEEVVESGTIKIGDSEPAVYEKKVIRTTTVNFANLLKDMVDYTQKLLDGNPKEVIGFAYDVAAPFVKMADQLTGALDTLDETVDTAAFTRKSTGIVGKIYWKLLARTHRKTVNNQKELINGVFKLLTDKPVSTEDDE